MTRKLPVSVTKEPILPQQREPVLRRFATIREAEEWLGTLRSPRAKRDLIAGRYSINAPEEML